MNWRLVKAFGWSVTSRNNWHMNCILSNSLIHHGRVHDMGRLKAYLAISWIISSLLMVVSPSHAAKLRVINGCAIQPGTACRGVDLSGQNLANVNLNGADLSGANLEGARLNGAKLQNAKLKDAGMARAVLRNANLMGATLKQADLAEADLTGANLVSTNTQYANLREANLSRVKASTSDFYGADLTEANLTRANFNSSNLTAAVLTGAVQKNTKLKDVIWDSPTDPGRDVFSITANGFSNNSPIPKPNTCGGVSPALQWERVPEGTQAFVLLVEDLDFSYGGTALPYGNWGLFNIPGSIRGLAEGASISPPEGTRNAVNDTIFSVAYSGGEVQQAYGYNAPCPPVFGEKHRFRFTLWALRVPAPLDAFNYEWKDFFSAAFPYTWVMPRVLEGTDPKYLNLSNTVLGKATLTGTVTR